ncbi:MAG: hypothetical protein ACLPOO_00925 [Terriglobales bacterium]
MSTHGKIACGLIVWIAFILAACGGGGSSSNSSSSAPVNVTGVWKLVAHSNTFNTTLTAAAAFGQSGSSISGPVILSGQPCESTAILMGSVAGDTLTFQLFYTVDGVTQQLPIVNFTGTINGVSMGGTYTSAATSGCGSGDQGTWTASPSAGVVSLSINTVPVLASGPITATVPSPSTTQFYAFANGSISQDETQVVTWNSSNTAVGTISTGGSSGNGLLSVTAGGTTNVTATITNAATGALVTSNTVLVQAP